jgi:hypothetical protein
MRSITALLATSVLFATDAAAAITICEVTTYGPVCHVTAIDRPATPPMCLDGNMHLVPCSDVVPGPQTRCSMTVEWTLLDPDHPDIVTLTPACADEADVATSQTVTKILKLGK